jgi:hypothetical protein
MLFITNRNACAFPVIIDLNIGKVLFFLACFFTISTFTFVNLRIAFTSLSSVKPRVDAVSSHTRFFILAASEAPTQEVSSLVVEKVFTKVVSPCEVCLMCESVVSTAFLS